MQSKKFHLAWFAHFAVDEWLDAFAAAGGNPWDGKFYLEMARAAFLQNEKPLGDWNAPRPRRELPLRRQGANPGLRSTVFDLASWRQLH